MGTHSLRNFTQGELSSKMISRTDLNQYHNGVSELKNFQILPQGGIERRPGTLFASEVRNPPTINLSGSTGLWSASSGGTNEFYLTRWSGEPNDVLYNYFSADKGTVGSLSDHEWGFGDNDSIGEDRLYVRDDSGDPDGLAEDLWQMERLIRILPFVYSQSQSYILVLFDGHIRFYTNGGGQVDSGGSAYEIEHPYADDALVDLRFVQSNDVLFIVHPEYKLRRLERNDHTDWSFATPDLDKGPYLTENTDDSHTITPTDNGDGTADLSASEDTFTEGNVGGLFKLKHPRNDTQLDGSFGATGTSSSLQGKGSWKLVTHGTWTGTLKLQRSFDGGSTWQDYQIYSSSADNNALATGTQDEEATFRLNMSSYTSGTCKYTFAIFDYYTESVIRITGYTDTQNVTGNILQPSDNSLKSDADGNSTAIWAEGAWSDRRGWPSTVCFFEQRLLMAGTDYRPQTIWGSKIDRYEDFEVGTNDDDPYAYAFDSDRRNPITWLIPAKSLLVGTAGGIWRIGGGSNFRDPITPTNVLARREVVEGTQDAFVMQDKILFVGRENKSLTELSYNYANDQYVPNDMTILAPHMLNDRVQEFAFTSEPYDTAWFRLEASWGSGTQLKSFIREPQHEISGWARHEFGSNVGGTIKSIASIPGTYGDELFMAVERLIDGKSPKTRIYIELIQPHHWDFAHSAVHLDSSLEYHKAVAQQAFSNLDHLEGETISVWVDGATHPDVRVSGGEITLDDEAYDVIAGIGYESVLKTMPLPYVPDKKGRIPQVVADLYETILGYINTIGIKNYAATNEGERALLVSREVLGFMDNGIDVFTGAIERQIETQIDRQMIIEISQYAPAPLTLLALHLENVVWE